MQKYIYKLNFDSRKPIYIESEREYMSFLVQLENSQFFLKLQKKLEVQNQDPRRAIVKTDLSSVEVWNLPKISDKTNKQQDELYIVVD